MCKMPYVGHYYEDPSAKLWDGVYKNNYKKIEEAFKEGADVNMKNDNGVWFLLVASGHGNARTVNLLLEKGIYVNITDDYDYNNNTALSTAVINAKYDVVELLIEKGADINKENNKGDTPLIHAIKTNNIIDDINQTNRNSLKSYIPANLHLSVSGKSKYKYLSQYNVGIIAKWQPYMDNTKLSFSKINHRFNSNYHSVH